MRMNWLKWVGQAISASAALLTWTALLVVWFRVPGTTPPGNGCPAAGPCSIPFVEVLPIAAAVVLALVGVLMLVVATIPRAAIAGFVAGFAAVFVFDYFVYVAPADRPAIVGPILAQATLLVWLGGVLAVAGAAILLVTRRMLRRDSVTPPSLSVV
jgi:hypothetical protein